MLDDEVTKVPILRGDQSSLKIGDPVYNTNRVLHIRCGFGVLGETISPLGEFIADSYLSYSEAELSRLFKTT
jgi:F0F1-type ATP synthase alpha subunit